MEKGIGVITAFHPKQRKESTRLIERRGRHLSEDARRSDDDFDYAEGAERDG
jgi:hypothetical protein